MARGDTERTGSTGYARFGAAAASEPRRPFSALAIALMAGSAIAAGLILFLIVQVWQSNATRDRALARERHSYDVMLVTRSVDTAMARSESALGRFTASGDPGLGTTYYNDWIQAGAQIDQLASLVTRDPRETALVRQLDSLYEARGKELGLVATRAYYKQGWPALVLYTSAGRSPLIGRIDRTLDAISEYERAKLEARYEQSDATAIESNRLIKLLSITGLALILTAAILAWLTWAALQTQREALAEAALADDRAAELERAVLDRTRALRDANDRLHQEMTERVAAEAQLRQIQKMEAVGQLTGGIAHDFNNMLAVVVGGLDLAKRRLESEAAEVGRHIDNAMEGASRAAALTRRLLGFARAEALLPEAIDPGGLIAGMSDMIDRTLGERIAVRTRVADERWRVWVDPLQLENAILNLAVNARDAMDGAGTLSIAVDNVVLAAGEVGAAPAGEHVCISVSDTGCGMTPEVAERVFEPFFTTKPVGKGTGLGLSQIFGFVRQSSGDVAIRSAPGAGTTVSLYLPRDTSIARAEPAPRPAHEPTPLPAAAPATPIVRANPDGEPILVVEDDPRVRVSTVAVLEELGYAPIAFDSGADALAALGGLGRVRLMITDVVMPGMTGPELHAAVRVRRPDMGVLFVTGYAGEAGDGGGLSGQAVLRKPFTVAALEQAVNDALARLSAPHPGQGAEAAE